MVNVGDNAWIYGVYVCPDVDIATYALAGLADRERGWGIDGDTFGVIGRLSKLGDDAWFGLGDLDLATCLYRTQMMREGATLTQASDRIRRALGVKTPVLPATDSEVETRIATPGGELHLQEFWVKNSGRPRVTGVRYKGARQAAVTAAVRKAVRDADRIVVCPANPVTSVGPILALKGAEALLESSRARKVALSPMAGGAPFSGPAGKLLRAKGVRTDSVGVASIYSGFLDAIVISESDSSLRPEVEGLGVECALSDTLMESREDEVRLAKELLEI